MSAAICKCPAVETHLLDGGENEQNASVLQTAKQMTCDHSKYLKFTLKGFTQNL